MMRYPTGQPVSEFSAILPGFIICVSVYIIARVINMHEATKAQKAVYQKELNRLSKIDALYGREKDD